MPLSRSTSSGREYRRPPLRFIGLIWANRVSQNRSTCWGISSSSATSLMVRNASGALSKCQLLSTHLVGEDAVLDVLRGRNAACRSAFLVSLAFAVAVGDGVAVDALLQNRRRFEHHHTARRDRHFGTGLRVTSDTLTLLAHHKRTE